MGRKKKKTVKPWCWYCNREFEDDKVLTFHQKAKHFKCHICHKKLFSAPGLAIHCSQVHKETVSHVPNAVAGRDNIEVEIFGMEGIPEADRLAHELHKTGRANVEGPEAKRPRLQLMGMAMANTPAPGMMYPVMAGMGPPGMMPMMPPPPGGAIPQPPQPQLPVPPRPLFPGGAPPSSEPSVQGGMAAPGELPKPAFPAYQNAGEQPPPPPMGLPEGPPRQAEKVLPVGPGCKLMHPEEDLSLEEIRSCLLKYRASQVASAPRMPNSSAPPFMGGAGGPPVIRPGMAPMMGAIRPGFPPPPMQPPGQGGW